MSLQHLKTNPYRLSAEVNAVWNPPYPRAAGEGEVIAEIPSQAHGECIYMAAGWMHFVGDLVELAAAAWYGGASKFNPDVGLNLQFSSDPNYLSDFAILTKEFRPIHCSLQRPESGLSEPQENELFRAFLTHLDSPQKKRMQMRLLLSQGEHALVKGFVEDFYSRKSEQDRETDFDSLRRVQLEHLEAEIYQCGRILALFEKQENSAGSRS